MSRAALRSLLVFLSILGLADAAYLTQHALTNTALSCGITGLSGCNVVAQSSYSHLFGIPLGVYGIVFYSCMLIAAFLVREKNTRRFMQGLGALGGIGFVSSMYFLGIQIFAIKALCVYCVGSCVISTVIFAITLLLGRKSSRPQPVPV